MASVQQEAAEKLSVKEKVGYSLGDAAANFVFQTMLVFQLNFYTDVFGIAARVAGRVFLVARVADAFFDPIMGAIADRTKTRWGKFRPWVLWTALPFGIMGCVTFITPNFSTAGKVVYAYVTYMLMMAVYSANNTPYSALSGVMTGDDGERTSLSSYRFVAAMSAGFIVQGFALPMVHYFGGDDSAKGYQATMAVFGLLCVIFFVITFLTTKERILPDPTKHSTVRQDLAALAKNGPWIALFAVTLVLFVTLSMRGGVALYFFKYYLNKESWFPYFGPIGQVANILGIFLSKPLAMRFGKRNVFIAGLLGTAVFQSCFMLVPASAPELALVFQFLQAFVYGPTIPLLWAMMADVADYGEWTTGIRATGIIFSGIVFGLKAGLGFGGSIAGEVLDRYGYVPNVAQTQSALHGIKMTISILPGLGFLACAVLLLFYVIDRKMTIRMMDELKERRKGFAH